MSRYLHLAVLAIVILAFVAVDHARSPEPDHAALEEWRSAGAAGACAPCGAICDGGGGN